MVRRKNLCSSVPSVGDKNNHPWGKKWFIRGEGYYRPSISPWSGEDWFVRILRVLENCINPCQSTYSASSQTASPPLDKILTLGIINKLILLSLNRIFRGDGRGVRNEDQFVRILRVLLEVLLIVFLYNYAVHLLYEKSWDGYVFYSMLKQAEIDIQSTSNRKLPNFYEKVTDFLLESYRISKWWQNHLFTETCRICHIWRILTRWTMWLFMQTDWLFMQKWIDKQNIFWTLYLS